MASSEVEKIMEPVSIQDVEGVKRYLTPEVEAAVVNLAKSEEMQQLQHSLPEGGNNSSIPGVPEGESFLDSSSNGTKVSGQDPCEKEQVADQADELITAKSDQAHHETIKEAGLDAVTEDRVSPGGEAGEQISTPEVSLAQNEAAAPEACLENGSKDSGFSSGVEGEELEPENEKEATKGDMAASVESEVAGKETAVETGLLEEEKPADSDDVQDKGVILQEKNSIATEANETAESAEEAKICDDQPEKVVEAETEVEKAINSESREEANEQKEAAAEIEKHFESEPRELGEPAVAELVPKGAESETYAEKQEQVHEPDSKEAPEVHDAGTSKKEVQTEEEAFDATKPELEPQSIDDDDTVKKEESSNENATEGDAADAEKVEEPVKEDTIEDLQIDDQSASKQDIATPVETEVAEKEIAEQIGVQEEEKAADFDDVRDKGVDLQEKTSDVTEANETAAEAKISDDKPDEAEHIVETVEAETVEKKPLHSESHEEATDNEPPAEIDNHIESQSSTGEPTTAELVEKNGETDAEKQEEIVQPDYSDVPKVQHDAETSKEEGEVETKEEAPDAQKTELETKSNDDDIVKEEEATSSIGVNEVTEAPETMTVAGEDSTIHIVEKEVEVQKEEISKEDVKGDDAVDAIVEEPVKESTAEELKTYQSGSKEITEENEKAPEVTLQASPEGIEEEKLQKKEEGESVEQEKDEKPSVETSEETDIITPVASPEDKKEEAEVSNKDTTETIDEASPCIEATQDHESIDSTAQTSMEKEEGNLESEALGLSVESNEKKGLEEVAEISNNETSKVAEEVEHSIVPASIPEAEGNSSSKLDDDVAEEKAQIPKEDDKGDLSNENLAADTIEHSNREVLEQSETAAEVESSSTLHEKEEKNEVVVVETAPASSGEGEATTEAETSLEEQSEEPVKEGKVDDLGTDDQSANEEIVQNDNAPEAALETSAEGEKIEALPMEEKETEEEDSNTEGNEEEEVHKKTEQAETVERAIEVPQVHSEDAEMVQEGTGELTTPETEQKPSLESSEDVGVSPLAASPEEDKEVTEGSDKPTTETVDEPDATVPTSVEKEEGSLETEAPGLEEVAEIRSKEASEIGAVQEEVEEKLVIPVSSEAKGNASTKLDDVVEEKADMPKEGPLNEGHATDSTEQIPVEELQKGEENVELSNEEVVEQSETAAKVESISPPQEIEQADEVVNGAATTIEAEPSVEEKREEHGSSITPVEDYDTKAEVAETDESIEKETSEGKEVESVLHEEQAQETGTAQENPEELVTEHEIGTKDELTEASGEITNEVEKAEVQQKEDVPEVIQAADEVKELEKTMEDKEEPPKETPEHVENKTELEPALGEGEKTSVELEVVEAIDNKQEVIEEVKESVPSSTETEKATDSNEQKEAVTTIIQDAPTVEKEILVAETREDGNAMVEGIEKPLAPSAAAPAEKDEETLKGEIIEEDHEEKKQPSDAVCESVIPVAGILEAAIMQEEEVKGNVEGSVVAESEAIPEQLPKEKHVVQSSEIPSHVDDYETKAVIENSEEEVPKDVVVSEPDTAGHPLELQTTEETSLKEVQPRELETEAGIANKPVVEQEKEEGASQTVEEEIKEASEVVETTNEDKLADEKSIEEEKAEEQHEAEPPALPAKEEEKESSTEVSVPDEVDQKQEASDSTKNEAVQAIPEEPEVLLDEPKQTEEESKVEEVEKETQGKEIQEETISLAVDITEETIEIPEAAVAENVPKQALVEQDKVEKQVEKRDNISEAETTEISDGTAEDKPKQAEEEAGELNVTTQVDAQVEEDVQGSEKVQKQDEATVATEETKEVSASMTMTEDEPTKETEEASRPVEQASREFQVPEVEPEVEKGSHESEESAITEEAKKEVSDEVATKPATQETKPLEENEITHPESLPVEKPEEEQPGASDVSQPIQENSKEAKAMEAEASLIKEEPIVEVVPPKEGQEVKEEASELVSSFEFPGFTQPKELEQQVTTECPTGNEESKETAETQDKTVDLITVTKKETLESASEGSSQELVAKPEDDAVDKNQEEETTAEQAVKEKEIILESKPESEEKAERIHVDESEPKESQNEVVNHEKESNPSEGDVKMVEEEEAKVKTEEAKAEATTVIDKELGTEISQRDLPMKLVEEATPEKQISTDNETINPAKLSLFDMMAQSSRERHVVIDSAEEKKETITGGDETKATEAEPEKAKSDGEKEHDEEHEEDEREREDNHKNDSGSDGVVIVEASKEPEVKVVTTTPQKKSHNILSEVGSKVKHSISKVRKVITGKSSSHQPKQNSPKQHSPK